MHYAPNTHVIHDMNHIHVIYTYTEYIIRALQSHIHAYIDYMTLHDITVHDLTWYSVTFHYIHELHYIQYIHAIHDTHIHTHTHTHTTNTSHPQTQRTATPWPIHHTPSSRTSHPKGLRGHGPSTTSTHQQHPASSASKHQQYHAPSDSRDCDTMAKLSCVRTVWVWVFAGSSKLHMHHTFAALSARRVVSAELPAPV